MPRRKNSTVASPPAAPAASTSAVMIGEQATGMLEGITVSAVAHEGLSIDVGGRPGRLAIVDDQGRVVASGPAVADEVEAVAINSYRAFLRGKGHLRTFGRQGPEDITTSPLPTRSKEHA